MGALAGGTSRLRGRGTLAVEGGAGRGSVVTFSFTLKRYSDRVHQLVQLGKHTYSFAQIHTL